MNVLVLGSGGREHAIADRCLSDADCANVFVLPGNPGMEMFSAIKTVAGDANDFEFVLAQVSEYDIDLVIVGPEALLEAGIADYLREKNIPVVGTGKEGAKLESSKAFSKDFMAEFNIPTATYQNFSDSELAKQAILAGKFGSNPVVKASALAAGKGVFVTKTHDEACQAVEDIFHNDNFKVFSNEIVIEANLKGQELSSFALYDGDSYVLLGHACDYKRLQDNDEGPNTGGMGTWTPNGMPTSHIEEIIKREVFDKVLHGLKQRGIDFKGILFAGLMINADQVHVIEFNVRLGDPETQVLLPLLTGSFVGVLKAAALGKLSQFPGKLAMNTSQRAVHVVKVSKNYPSLDGTPMLLGQKICIKDSLRSQLNEKTKIYFAGVKNAENDANDIVNSGGRVFGITAIGNSTDEAREKVYQLISEVTFEGQFYRTDIAK